MALEGNPNLAEGVSNTSNGINIFGARRNSLAASGLNYTQSFQPSTSVIFNTAAGDIRGVASSKLYQGSSQQYDLNGPVTIPNGQKLYDSFSVAPIKPHRLSIGQIVESYTGFNIDRPVKRAGVILPELVMILNRGDFTDTQIRNLQDIIRRFIVDIDLCNDPDDIFYVYPNWPWKDKNSIENYYIKSSKAGHIRLRILRPENMDAPENAGATKEYLHILDPSEGNEEKTFGNGIEYFESKDWHNRKNVTLVQWDAPLNVWYGNHEQNATSQYADFIVDELIPWLEEKSGDGTHKAIGFSKSGFGAINLLFNYPEIFKKVASYDAPYELNDLYEFNSLMGANFGSADNLRRDWNLGVNMLRAKPFLEESEPRIWIGRGDDNPVNRLFFEDDALQFSADLIASNIPFEMNRTHGFQHHWNGGDDDPETPNSLADWVTPAMEFLFQN